jgi:hypothetical protein
VGRVDGDVFTFATDGRVLGVGADPDSDVAVRIAIRNYVEDVGVCFSGTLSPAE